MTSILERSALCRDVLAKVDGEWRTGREIYRLVGAWAYPSLRYALQQLEAEGLVERRMDPHPSGEIGRFRRSVDRASPV